MKPQFRPRVSNLQTITKEIQHESKGQWLTSDILNGKTSTVPVKSTFQHRDFFWWEQTATLDQAFRIRFRPQARLS